MKKILKSRKFIVIISIIITAIIASSVCIYATTKYLSSEVAYEPSDSSWNVDNVESALNSLYSAASISTDELSTLVRQIVKEERLNQYPVGSIYISESNTNPSEFIGGTWESYGQGRTLIGAGDKYSAGNVGGNEQITLTTESLPSHTHSIPSLTGTAEYVSLTGNTYNHVGWTGGSTTRTSGIITMTPNSSALFATGSAFYAAYMTINASHSHTVTTVASTTGSTRKWHSYKHSKSIYCNIHVEKS